VAVAVAAAVMDVLYGACLCVRACTLFSRVRKDGLSVAEET